MNLKQDLKCTWGFKFSVFLISFSFCMVQPSLGLDGVMLENGVLVVLWFILRQRCWASYKPHLLEYWSCLAYCLSRFWVGRSCTWGGLGCFSVLLSFGGLEKAEGETTSLPGRKQQQKDYDLNLFGRPKPLPKNYNWCANVSRSVGWNTALLTSIVGYFWIQVDLIRHYWIW